MTNNSFPFRQEFVAYLEIELELSPYTVEGYLLDLQLFFIFLELEYFLEGVKIEGINTEHIREFMAFLKHERQNAAKTRNRKLTSLRNYFDFLKISGYLKNRENPAKKLRNARVPERLPVYLALDEAEAFLKASLTTSPYPYRDHCLMRLFLQAGPRAQELLQLETGDINLKEKELLIRGKGAKERIIPLTDSSCQVLEAHLEKRLPDYTQQEKVFLNHKGVPLSNRGVELLFHKICKKAGIRKPHLSVHKLRHTCFTMLLKEGVDIRVLKELAGHESIDSTEIYVHVANEEVRRAMDKHPLA